MRKKSYRVLFVIGTRPDAIKLAPVIREFRGKFLSRVVATTQHRELLKEVIEVFRLQVHVDFNLMKENQDLFYLTSGILSRMRETLEEIKPDIIFVQGDTTTSFIASLAAFYFKIPVAHVEAGLRTHDPYAPYPEEMNRVFVDHLSSLCFAPTPQAKENLLKDGIPEERIHVVGNTGIDAMFWVLENVPPGEEVKELVKGDKKIVLLTVHRRENFGEPLREIFRAVREIAEERRDVLFVYPVHPNPNVKRPAEEMLGNVENILLLTPLSYPDLLYVLKHSSLVLTDSGGIQEEAPYFGVRIGVLREKTERPEGVKAGYARVLGSDRERIKEWFFELIEKPSLPPSSLYGDGKASERIRRITEVFLESFIPS